VSCPDPDQEHDGSAVDTLLAAVRTGVVRVTADRLAAEVEAGAMVVDTRPVEQRARDGELAGAVVVDRNVLEWRLDPTCPHRLADAPDADRRIIVVCNEGYSSSLAAESLRRLGLRGATDLVGGYQAVLALSRRLTGPPALRPARKRPGPPPV
jgi:rhodanese-related sulfurtransferase